MMASSFRLQILRSFSYLVALLWTMSCNFSVAESHPTIYLTGQVGGNVTFRCPVDKKRPLTSVYLQIGHVFVNGYHKSRDIQHPVWENTKINRNENTVDMYWLNISHSRNYTCFIRYSDSDHIEETPIQLTVTANYSRPVVTTSCVDGVSCLVTCVSHGGHPHTNMMWNVPVPTNTSSQSWKVVNSSEVPSPTTMLYNSSSTAYFNCSTGELKHVSCFVGDVTSPLFSVCTPKVPETNSTVIIAVIVICIVVAVIMVVVLLMCCKTRHAGAAAGAAQLKKEWQVNGHEEELIDLEGGREAS